MSMVQAVTAATVIIDMNSFFIDIVFLGGWLAHDLLGHAFASIIGTLQILFPVLVAPLALGLLRESGELKVVIVLHLIGVIGNQVVGLPQAADRQYSIEP